MRKLILVPALFVTLAIAQDHGGAKAEHEGGGGHAPSSVQTWKWANFAILAGLIGYGISKAAGPFFRGRSEEIQKALVDARRMKEDAEARAAGIDARMLNLGAEIESLRTEARREMAAEAERVQQETARLAAKIEANAAQELTSITRHAIRELRAHAAGLALQLAEQKVRSRMTPGAQDLLVDTFASRLGRPGASN